LVPLSNLHICQPGGVHTAWYTPGRLPPRGYVREGGYLPTGVREEAYRRGTYPPRVLGRHIREIYPGIYHPGRLERKD